MVFVYSEKVETLHPGQLISSAPMKDFLWKISGAFELTVRCEFVDQCSVCVIWSLETASPPRENYFVIGHCLIANDVVPLGYAQLVVF